MLERVGERALDEMEAYLAAHCAETIFARHDLLASRRPGHDPLAAPRLVGYRLDGRLVGVQAFYRSGKWLPHLTDARVLDAMLDDAAVHLLRWTVGPERVITPLLRALAARGVALEDEEPEMLQWVDAAHFCTQPADGVRRAEVGDVARLAELRCLFEVEYFAADAQTIPPAWCLSVARRYVAEGAYLAERGGRAAAMVAVEAEIPELVQVGAVYTREEYRGRGLAKAVVSALCQEALARRRLVTLTVRESNLPAVRAYRSLGFQPWMPYRMCRLR